MNITLVKFSVAIDLGQPLNTQVESDAIWKIGFNDSTTYVRISRADTGAQWLIPLNFVLVMVKVT